jgi:hypothetical protein
MNLDIEQLETLPTRSKMKEVSDWDYHSDYPWKRLDKWFRAQVGRLSDQVYSDFHFLSWVPRKYKTREYYTRHVETHVVIENGKFRIMGHGREYFLPTFCDTLYVHPISKLICLSPKVKVVRIKKEKTFILLGDYHNLEKIDGIWYEFKAIKNNHRVGWHPENLKKYNEYFWRTPIALDKSIGPKSSLASEGQYRVSFNSDAYWTLRAMKIQKRQLSSHELRAMGLKNN